jgi:hypothetical protein
LRIGLWIVSAIMLLPRAWLGAQKIERTSYYAPILKTITAQATDEASAHEQPCAYRCIKIGSSEIEIFIRANDQVVCDHALSDVRESIHRVR